MTKTIFSLFFVTLLFCDIIQASEPSSYVIKVPDSHFNIGMFSSCNLVLGHLHKFEIGQYPHVNGVMVNFDDTAIYYEAAYGPNWWTYYFEPLKIGKIKGQPNFFSEEENLSAWEARRQLTREQASELVKKHIKINAVVRKNVNKFIRKHFKSSFIIGVHYRGTDKVSEAPRVSYAETIAKIQEFIDSLDGSVKDYLIFVATDEKAFLEYAKASFPKKVIALNAYRSSTLSNIHHSKKHSPYRLGMEAVLDMCLLSKCNVLIRTSSSLSLWSTYMNPEIPVIMLNKRCGMPE